MATQKGKAEASSFEGQDVSASEAVRATRHRAKRKNIPPAGLEAQGRVEEAPKAPFAYNRHLPPGLRFADDPADADRLPQQAPWRVGVTVIDPRGNEGLRVLTMASH